ncbi:unannotated protein [freshwater metagenome]|uniref:Unannotated protein n=1 Tax=freshwater metagenome TaxID=449393 RepID=A0A6J5Z506_9ZZZZ
MLAGNVICNLSADLSSLAKWRSNATGLSSIASMVSNKPSPRKSASELGNLLTSDCEIPLISNFMPVLQML